MLDGEHLSLIKLNEIDMTEPVIATEASEEFKQPTEPKEEEEPKVDKEAEKEKLNQGLNSLNEEINWIVDKFESGETADTSVLKIKFNKYFKTQMKVLNQTIEEPQFPDPEQLDLPPDVTLQIVKKPKLNKSITLDKRFRLLSKQKREIKEEEKVEDPKAKGKDAKGKKVEETVEQELPEWE